MLSEGVYLKELDTLQRGFVSRLGDEHRTCQRKVKELQGAVEAKVQALHDTEMHLMRQGTTASLRQQQTIQAALTTIADWKAKYQHVITEWSEKTAKMEKKHQEALARLEAQNVALVQKFKCALSNRKFLADVNARLSERVEKLDADLAATAAMKEERQICDGEVAHMKKEGMELMKEMQGLEVAKAQAQFHVAEKVASLQVLNRQLQLRLQDIQGLERQVREERDKYHVLQRAMEDKEEETKRLHELLRQHAVDREQGEQRLQQKISEVEALSEVERRERHAQEQTAITWQAQWEEERRLTQSLHSDLMSVKESCNEEKQQLQRQLDSVQEVVTQLKQNLAAREAQIEGHDQRVRDLTQQHSAEKEQQAKCVEERQAQWKDALQEKDKCIAHEVEQKEAKQQEVEALRDRIQALLLDSTQSHTQLLLQKEQLLGEVKSSRQTITHLEADVRRFVDDAQQQCGRTRAECDAIADDFRKGATEADQTVARLQSSVDHLRGQLATEEAKQQQLEAERRHLSGILRSSASHAGQLVAMAKRRAMVHQAFARWRVAFYERRTRQYWSRSTTATACVRFMRNATVLARSVWIYSTWDRLVRRVLMRQADEVRRMVLVRRFAHCPEALDFISLDVRAVVHWCRRLEARRDAATSVCDADLITHTTGCQTEPMMETESLRQIQEEIARIMLSLQTAPTHEALQQNTLAIIGEVKTLLDSQPGQPPPYHSTTIGLSPHAPHGHPSTSVAVSPHVPFPHVDIATSPPWDPSRLSPPHQPHSSPGRPKPPPLSPHLLVIDSSTSPQAYHDPSPHPHISPHPQPSTATCAVGTTPSLAQGTRPQQLPHVPVLPSRVSPHRVSQPDLRPPASTFHHPTVADSHTPPTHSPTMGPASGALPWAVHPPDIPTHTIPIPAPAATPEPPGLLHYQHIPSGPVHGPPKKQTHHSQPPRPASPQIQRPEARPSHHQTPTPFPVTVTGWNPNALPVPIPPTLPDHESVPVVDSPRVSSMPTSDGETLGALPLADIPQHIPTTGLSPEQHAYRFQQWKEQLLLRLQVQRMQSQGGGGVGAAQEVPPRPSSPPQSGPPRHTFHPQPASETVPSPPSTTSRDTTPERPHCFRHAPPEHHIPRDDVAVPHVHSTAATGLPQAEADQLMRSMMMVAASVSGGLTTYGPHGVGGPPAAPAPQRSSEERRTSRHRRSGSGRPARRAA